MPNFFINVKEKGAKKAELSIKSLTKSLGVMTAGFIGANQAVDFLKKSITMSAEMEGVRKGFENLAQSSGFSRSAFDNFKKATDGTIDSLTLMTKANNAMLLGIADSEQQMADMFDIAQRLGKSLGIDTAQSIDSLVTGLGRQSKLMLDNLGIMVDTEKVTEQYAESIGKTVSELTDQERKQAFVNGAMEEADRLVKQLGEETLTTKDSIAQASVELETLSITIGDRLAPATQKVSGMFTDWVSSISDVLFAQGELSDNTLSSVNDVEKLTFAADEIRNELQQLGVYVGSDFIPTFSKAFEDTATHREKDRVTALLEELGSLQQRLGVIASKNNEIGEVAPFVQTEEDVKNANVQLEGAIDNYVELDETIKKTTASNKIAGEQRKKLTKEELEAYALTGRTARSAMAKVVKAEMMEAVAGYIASIFKNVPFPVNAILAAGAGGAVSAAFDRNLKAHVKEFATGGDFVTNGKQLIMVGDNPSGRERVQITPLGGDPAPDAPSGSNITLNISAPLVDETIVDTIIPAINDAVRRGETLATS